ncbi:MAG: GNAT family N-acetyltransferase [Chloroflexi bacterium]|nr:GNAT family N-acetyltransferase [Chloroflexota bacterium]
MPNPTIYQQSDFPATLKWQAIAFIKTEWPFVFTGDDMFLTEPCSPDMDPVHFVVTEGDSLISYASIFRLSLNHSGTSYEVYGFGNMFTFPPYRKQGYGRQVLELATDFIKRNDVDVAILFSEPQVEMIYAACGWEPAPAPTRIGIPNDYEVLEGVKKMILYVSEKGQQGKLDFENQPLYVEWPW